MDTKICGIVFVFFTREQKLLKYTFDWNSDFFIVQIYIFQDNLIDSCKLLLKKYATTENFLAKDVPRSIFKCSRYRQRLTVIYWSCCINSISNFVGRRYQNIYFAAEHMFSFSSFFLRIIDGIRFDGRIFVKIFLFLLI